MRNKHKILLGCVFLAFYVFNTFAQECPVYPDQRDLIIINDPYFAELMSADKTMIENMIMFLLAQASPMLIQTSIWQHFLKELNEGFSFLKNNIQEASFEFYSIGSSFVLIVPQQYKKKVGDEIGLNLDREQVPTIKDPFSYAPLSYVSFFQKNKLSLVEVLKLLLDGDKKNSYAWNIILKGHGTNICSYTIIAGLDVATFKDFLRFCNSDIKTNLLTYSTCFGGSKKSLVDAYSTKEVPNRYNFPIIISGLGDAPSYSWITKSFKYYKTDPSFGEKTLFSDIDRIRYFFDQLHTIPLCKAQSEAVVQLMDNLYQFRQVIETAKRGQRPDLTYALQKNLNNVMQVRWPRSSQFQPMPMAEFIAVATELPEERRIWGTEIKELAFIIDVPYLDRPIKLVDEKRIQSSMPGQKWHYIRSIRIPSATLEHFLESFSLQAPQEQSIWGGEEKEKNYLIDYIDYGGYPGKDIAEKAIVFLSQPTMIKSASKQMFYLKNNSGHIIKPSEKKSSEFEIYPEKTYNLQQLTPEQTTYYLNLFEEQRLALMKQESLKKRSGGLSELLEKSKKKEGTEYPS